VQKREELFKHNNLN
jgi:hypothetical protein